MHNGKRKRRCAKDCVFYTPEKHSPRYREIRWKICTGKKRRPCVIYVSDDPFIPFVSGHKMRLVWGWFIIIFWMEWFWMRMKTCCEFRSDPLCPLWLWVNPVYIRVIRQGYSNRGSMRTDARAFKTREEVAERFVYLGIFVIKGVLTSSTADATELSCF